MPFYKFGKDDIYPGKDSIRGADAMWKLTVISVLLGAAIIGISFVTIRHLRKPVFTSSSFLKLSRDIKLFRTYNPYTVTIGSHLFTISSHPNYIDVKSSDWTYEACQMEVEPKDKISGRIEAAVLGEKILVWGFNEIDYEDFEESVQLANYNLLMVDPWRCNYTVLENFGRVVPKIVVNKKSVDVLCPSHSRNCLSRRFNENGKAIELHNQIDFQSTEDVFLQGFNQDQNYVFAPNYENGTKIIKILDKDYNVLKQIDFNFIVKKLAVSSRPSKSQIGVLYEQPKHQFHIAVFDSNLQPVFTAKLHEPDEYEAFASYLAMDSSGNSFVTSVLVSNTEKYDLVRYDANGHLVTRLDLDEYWRNEPLVTQTFLIEDSEYCLVNHYKIYDDSSFGRTYIKCINVS